MTISMYQASVPAFSRALNNLAAILEKGAAHAQARKTLVAQASSFFPKLPRPEIEAIVSRLETEGKISFDNHRLNYHF